MSTLSVATISGVTTLTGGGFDQIGASANSANAAAIASMTTANLALLTANISNTTANATTLAMSTFVGTQNGQIIMTTNTAVPYGGYLLCDGSVYNRSAYPNLANVANIAQFSGVYMANVGLQAVGYYGTINSQLPGQNPALLGLSASNNGILFQQAMQVASSSNPTYTLAFGSSDNGITWRSLSNTVSNYGNVSVGIFRQHNLPQFITGIAGAAAGGGITYHPTIAYNGTNYVTGNIYQAQVASGVRYGSNVFALNTYTVTNINFVVEGIVWTGARFIACGSTGAGSNTVSYSSDGVTWTVGGGVANASSAINNGYKRMSYANNTLVIGTSNTVSQANMFSFPIIRYSQDNGISFSTATQPSGFGVNSGFNSSNCCIRYVGYLNNQFIAVDHAGAIANSPNGVTWSLVAAANTLGSSYSPMSETTDAVGNQYVSGSSTSLYQAGMMDARSVSWNMDYTQGYYVFGSTYSTDLINWKRFPAQSAKKNAMTPMGHGVTLPTSNVYYFPGSTNFGFDGGACPVSYTPAFPGGYWNPYPTTGAQFAVPYLTDEVSGVVKYYIKT